MTTEAAINQQDIATTQRSLLSKASKRGEVWALVSVVCYTMINLLVRQATGQGDRSIAVTLRALPTFFITLIVILMTQHRRAQLIPGSNGFLGWKSITAILVQALLIFSVGNSLHFESLKWGGVTITTPISSTSAIFGGLLAYLVLGEVFNWEMLVGMVVTTAGVFILMQGQARGIPVSEYWSRAVIFSLIEAFCAAVGGILLTYALRRGADVFVAMWLSTGMAITSMFVVLAAQGQLSLYWSSPPEVVRDLFFAGLINTLSVLAITQALALSPWAVVTSISRLGVVTGPLAAMFLLGEHINGLMAVGILLVLLGVVVVQWGQARGKQHLPEPPLGS